MSPGHAPIPARFYDGRSSSQKNVLIYPAPPTGLRVVGDGVDFSCGLAEVRDSGRLGNTPRHLHFRDGSQCESDDNDAIDRLFAEQSAGLGGRLLHLWESRYGYVLAALVGTVVVLWAVVNYGLPALAKEAAFALPESAERAIGQGALEQLDASFLQPSKLLPGRQEQLRTLFRQATASLEGASGYRLELRSGERVGANAFALPSGQIVVTDALVDLAASDDELLSVLAHEIGHLRQRHLLRRLLQGSATALVIIAVTGDISTMGSLAAALPTVLIENKFSRDFEREADDFALDFLRRRGIPASAFSDILLRLEEKRGGKSGGFPDYLSSHPGTEERAARARSGG
jgi:predicted Zn-dependent protease